MAYAFGISRTRVDAVIELKHAGKLALGEDHRHFSWYGVRIRRRSVH